VTNPDFRIPVDPTRYPVRPDDAVLVGGILLFQQQLQEALINYNNIPVC
jgi:hypothetical protein